MSVPVRPALELATQALQAHQLPRWVRWMACALGALLWVWPYLGVLGMIEITDITLLECAIALIVGSFLGPMVLQLKAKAMGNTVDKTDFVGMIVGMLGGAFVGYIAVELWGGALGVPFGDLSPMIVTLLAAVIGSIIVTLIALAMAGDDWAVKMMDVDHDGDVDLDDVTLAAKAAAGAVKETVKKL